AKDNSSTTMLENVADIKMINTPTEVDHYQLFRKIDVYVSPKGEDLGSLAGKVQKIVDNTKLPANTRVEMRGSVKAHAPVVLEFRRRTAAGDRAGLPDPDGAVCVLPRSLHHPAGHTVGHHRGDSFPSHHWNHAECHVVDGRAHDDRHRCFQQHSDRGRNSHVSRSRHVHP